VRKNFFLFKNERKNKKIPHTEKGAKKVAHSHKALETLANQWFLRATLCATVCDLQKTRTIKR
jgi:hypothetical protein